MRSTDSGELDAWRLLRWGDLEERRRRAARRGASSVSPWLYSVGAGVVVALLVMRGLGGLGDDLIGEATVAGTSRLWLTILISTHALVMFGAPFRMYWRRDSAFLARLPIRGRALFRLAWLRSLRATALVTIPCAMGALAFGPWLDWEVAMRHIVLVGVAGCGAGLLLPGVALAAGAIVASDKAQAVIESLSESSGGEFSAPKTSWLGMLPGVAATAVVLVLMAAASWALGAATTSIGAPGVVLGALVAGSLLVVGWAAAVADRVMRAALREVSALDQERLAHVDLTRPSPVERAWARLLRPGGRALFVKDVTLTRRRFPIPFFFGVVGVLAMWIVAAVAPGDMLQWAVVISASLGTYGFVMARRRALPPIEHPTYLRTLAIDRVDIAAAKRSQSLLWVFVYLLVGGIPVVLRAHDIVTTAAVLGAIMIATIVATIGSGTIRS